MYHKRKGHLVGATHKKRFYCLAGIGFLCSALLGFGMITGAVATNISLSSSSMKISSDDIQSSRLQLYSGLVKSKRPSDGDNPMIFIHLAQADLKNVCILIHTGDIPIIGEYNLVIRTNHLTADYLNLRVTNVINGITLHNLSIGIDPPHSSISLPPNTFSINADKSRLTNVSLDANYLSGDNVILHDSHISIAAGKNACRGTK